MDSPLTRASPISQQMAGTAPSYSIDKAGWRDLGEIHRLEQVCFGKDAHTILDVIGYFTLPGYLRLKAVSAEKIVGFIIGELPIIKKTGWITAIAVAPDFRRQGIGNTLLKTCEKEMNLPGIRLCVRQSNGTAQKLYLNAGYQSLELWKQYYYDGEDAMVMEKIVH